MPPVWVQLLARRRHASHSVGGIWTRQTSAMRNGHTGAAAQRPAGSVFVSPGGVVRIASGVCVGGCVGDVR